MNTVTVGGGLRLCSETPKLDIEETRRSFLMWSLGLVVPSVPRMAGYMSPPDDDVLTSHHLLGRGYGPLADSERLYELTAPSRVKLQEFAEADMARAGIVGKLRMLVCTGETTLSRSMQIAPAAHKFAGPYRAACLVQPARVGWFVKVTLCLGT